ncbi:unnamed protein product [Adineta ricciae]|uniref:Uncharacterized protein n=1 Tax=Adineta ricciae TaxID=249248 RepID=A0A814ELS5_ADIRI|nr:unnamed protein product [Adineta ricciae]
MNTSNIYEDKNEEYLHPFWLGILLLFAVITILSILCFIRRKCGSQIMRSCKIFFCGTDYDLENQAKKRSKELSLASPYNWAPAYNPVPNLSPKLYALVRNMQMNSFDREASIRPSTVDEDDDDVHDVFTIPDESEQMKTPSSEKTSETKQERNCETARKFYASMRHSARQVNSSSNDSGSNDLFSPTNDRTIQNNSNDHIKFFRSTRFFQSITKSTR